TLARFADAAFTAKSDPKGALAAYDALAADASIGLLFRDAARLRAALLRLDAGEVDAAKPALEALAGSGGVYRHTARLALGVVALIAGDYDGAGQWLDRVVADEEAPDAERRNAESLLGLVAANRPAAK
ncbi:MAG: tetratricopeptide repeat protein, partial [Roseiarcus sp.]